MPARTDLQPTAGRWHVVGVAGYLIMLALYAGAAAYRDPRMVDQRLWPILAAAVAATAAVILVGRRRHWQTSDRLLLGWPVAALLTTALVGVIEPAATRELPGTITLTFAYAGLTNPPRRSLILIPIGVLAFVTGGEITLSSGWPKVVITAAMWMLVAEVPAWLIGRLREQSRQLHAIAQTDALTGLYDRHTLESQLAAYSHDSAVLIIDLDDFKRYNDRHGHQAGDDVLMMFADTLRSSTRGKDIVFRIGGDEFLAILVGAGAAEAQHTVERLRKRWSGAGGPVEFSVGIATGPGDLVRSADEQMYRDKRRRDGAAG